MQAKFGSNIFYKIFDDAYVIFRLPSSAIKTTAMQPIKLSITEQCHESWDKMSPTNEGRFCNACAKQVVDFTAMSDVEILNYFNNLKNGTVCGRALPAQLDRNINSTVTGKYRWYWHYAMVFLFFFSKSPTAKAQGLVTVVKTPVLKRLPANTTEKYSTQPTFTDGLVIEGIIKDEEGNPIPFASIRLMQSNNGVSADEQGRFTLAVDNIPCMIEVSALDYATKQIPVTNFLEKTIVLTRKEKSLQEVLINNSGNCRVGRVVMGGISVVRIKQNYFKDTLQRFANFTKPAVSIYPNPVNRGNTFTVSLMLKQTGMYTLQVLDAAGRIMQQKKINAPAKKHNAALVSDSNWSNGIYFIRVMNEKGKLTGSASFTVQ